MKYECSRAKRPRRAAWLQVSVRAIQAEPGGKVQMRFGPLAWKSAFGVEERTQRCTAPGPMTTVLLFSGGLT